MATIRKRNDRYQVQIRRKGFPTITKSFPLLSDAKEWARHHERQADRGELGPDRKVLKTITLGELVERYRDEILPGRKGGKGETIMLNAFLRHPICKRSLSDLSTVDFVKWKDEKLAGTNRPSRPFPGKASSVSSSLGDGTKCRPGITPKSAKRLLSPIQHMFEVAIHEWEIPLRENPLSRFKLKVTDNKRQRRLREGELGRLLEAGKKNRNHVVPIIMFALETGMRRGEILALRLLDVDIQRQTATVRESKNGYSRTIPLTKEAVIILSGAIDRVSQGTRKPHEDETKNPILFPMAPNALLLSWNRLTKRAGIDDLHFHDLRHEAISRLFELGLTVPEVASISGHRDMRMLFRYAHANNAAIRAKLSRTPSGSGPGGPGVSSPKGRFVPVSANDNLTDEGESNTLMSI